MAVWNLEWYAVNATRRYPLDETATARTDDGQETPDNIIVDIAITLPKELGDYVYLGGLTVTSTLITAVFLASGAPVRQGMHTTIGPADATSNPIAAVSVLRKDLNLYRHYTIDPLLEGVGGWIVFGEGALHPFVGRYSTYQQSLLLPRCVSNYVELPVRSIGKRNSRDTLEGVVSLRAGNDLEITSEIITVSGRSYQAICVGLGDATTDESLFQKYAGPCAGRPESETRTQAAIELLGEAIPDCAGNIDITFEFATMTPLLVGGMVVSIPTGLSDICANMHNLPTPDGTLPGYGLGPTLDALMIPPDPLPEPADVSSLSLSESLVSEYSSSSMTMQSIVMQHYSLPYTLATVDLPAIGLTAPLRPSQVVQTYPRLETYTDGHLVNAAGSLHVNHSPTDTTINLSGAELQIVNFEDYMDDLDGLTMTTRFEYFQKTINIHTGAPLVADPDNPSNWLAGFGFFITMVDGVRQYVGLSITGNVVVRAFAPPSHRNPNSPSDAWWQNAHPAVTGSPDINGTWPFVEWTFATEAVPYPITNTPKKLACTIYDKFPDDPYPAVSNVPRRGVIRLRGWRDGETDPCFDIEMPLNWSRNPEAGAYAWNVYRTGFNDIPLVGSIGFGGAYVDLFYSEITVARETEAISDIVPGDPCEVFPYTEVWIDDEMPAGWYPAAGSFSIVAIPPTLSMDDNPGTSASELQRDLEHLLMSGPETPDAQMIAILLCESYRTDNLKITMDMWLSTSTQHVVPGIFVDFGLLFDADAWGAHWMQFFGLAIVNDDPYHPKLAIRRSLCAILTTTGAIFNYLSEDVVIGTVDILPEGWYRFEIVLKPSETVVVPRPAAFVPLAGTAIVKATDLMKDDVAPIEMEIALNWSPGFESAFANGVFPSPSWFEYQCRLAVGTLAGGPAYFSTVRMEYVT